MDGVFITGVDTGVGKSAVCAGLLTMMHSHRKVCYWKPIQTGTIVSDDTNDVKRTTNLGPEFFLEPAHRFAEPLAPHVAAKKWGKKIDVGELVSTCKAKADTGFFMIVEGAAGLLVPLNEKELQIDLIRRLGLPTIFIAEDRVGAINQTLLSLNAIRQEKLPVLGVILTRSRRTFGNAESIAHFGKVDILADLDASEDSRMVIAQIAGDTRLRELFQLPPLPA